MSTNLGIVAVQGAAAVLQRHGLVGTVVGFGEPLPGGWFITQVGQAVLNHLEDEASRPT